MWELGCYNSQAETELSLGSIGPSFSIVKNRNELNTEVVTPKFHKDNLTEEKREPSLSIGTSSVLSLLSCRKLSAIKFIYSV